MKIEEKSKDSFDIIFNGVRTQQNAERTCHE